MSESIEAKIVAACNCCYLNRIEYVHNWEVIITSMAIDWSRCENAQVDDSRWRTVATYRLPTLVTQFDRGWITGNATKTGSPLVSIVHTSDKLLGRKRLVWYVQR